ncbi:hypothetical protein ACLVWU_05235 [Bdellovibrio sp. HCB290]|uniref:hypothetical protein n=1 Tax=Bdellovibrio sp. HCB290 TaxID=3394356 RepID=UPI0039B4C531
MKLKIALIAASTLAFSIASAENVVVTNGKKYTCRDGATFTVNNGVAICDGKIIQPDSEPNSNTVNESSEEIAANVIDSALQKKPSKKKKSKKNEQPVARLDAETLRKKTFQAVNKTVSAEDFPQKCIAKYSISSKESTRQAQGTPEEIAAAVEKGKAEGLSTDELLERAKAAYLGNGKKTTQQLTATLIYKQGGVIKKDVILDLEASVEEASDLITNMKDVMVNFNDRYCKEFRADTESEDSAPASSNNNSNSNSSNSNNNNAVPGTR